MCSGGKSDGFHEDGALGEERKFTDLEIWLMDQSCPLRGKDGLLSRRLIGMVIGISHEGVRLEEARALRKLKRALISKGIV